MKKDHFGWLCVNFFHETFEASTHVEEDEESEKGKKIHHPLRLVLRLDSVNAKAINWKTFLLPFRCCVD